MTIRTAAIVLALGLGLGLGAPALYSSARPFLAPPTSPVIATISIDKVFNGLDERATMKKEFDDMAKRLDDELKAELTKLENEKKKLEVLVNEADKDSKTAELAQMAGMLEVKKQLYTAQLERRQAQMFTALYDRIAAACKKLAADRKFTMIMSSDDTQVIPKGARAADIERFIALKRMFYVDPAHDVTDDLVTMMNNQYKAGK